MKSFGTLLLNQEWGKTRYCKKTAESTVKEGKWGILGRVQNGIITDIRAPEINLQRLTCGVLVAKIFFNTNKAIFVCSRPGY